MANDLGAWIENNGEREGPIRHLPLELSLEIIDTMRQPQDIINFALANPNVLRYWLKLGEDLSERFPDHPALQDVESLLQADDDLPQCGPQLIDPNRGVIFEHFAKTTMNRLFSPELQSILMLIVYMPDPTHRVWDYDYCRANQLGKKFGLVGDADSSEYRPYWVMEMRRMARFEKLYKQKQYRNLLFSWRNFNRISPLCQAVHLFATDFAKKALSMQPMLAIHSAPSFAHQSLVRHGYMDIVKAMSLLQASPIQDLGSLHEVEQERLRLAFFQYESLCVTSVKITGYWEIDELVRCHYSDYDRWNMGRTLRSVLADASMCQAERVYSVYRYIRQLYLLLFWFEWRRYYELVRRLEQECPSEATKRAFEPSMDTPSMFRGGMARLEWIDILCSRGLVFLFKVLRMDATERTAFFVSTFYPTKAARIVMTQSQFLVGSVFDCLLEKYRYDGKAAVSPYDYTDLDATAPNIAWCRWWANPNALNFGKNHDYLIHSGYVFWEEQRCLELGFGSYESMRAKIDAAADLRVCCGDFPLDHPRRIYAPTPNLFGCRQVLNCAGWAKAREAFEPPETPPNVVWFGIGEESWRIAETKGDDGRPVEPSYF